MKNTLSILLSTAAIAVASSAFAADAEVKSKVEYKKNGGYETTRDVDSTNASGTKVTSNSDVDVSVDSKGLIERTDKSESKSDAKGLMNAKKTKTKTHYEEKADGGYDAESKTTSTNAAGANVTSKTTKDVDVDARGNVSATDTVKKTVDPKGLLNSKTSTDKVKTVNGTVVDQKKKID